MGVVCDRRTVPELHRLPRPQKPTLTMLELVLILSQTWFLAEAEWDSPLPLGVEQGARNRL